VTSFSVASSPSYTSSAGERKYETTWFNCQAWGKLAETCSAFLTKGQQGYLEGRVSRTYDKRDSGQGASVDVNVSQVEFLRGQQDYDAVGASQAAGGQGPDLNHVDGLPF
jgi:single-strand DNA-binding protein